MSLAGELEFSDLFLLFWEELFFGIVIAKTAHKVYSAFFILQTKEQNIASRDLHICHLISMMQSSSAYGESHTVQPWHK